MERIIEKFQGRDAAPFERTVETVPDTPAPATAIGYSITVNVGPVHQIVAQCFVAEDEPDAVVNEKMDRVFRFLDRRKAIYEVEALEAELVKHRETVINAKNDWKEADERHAKTLAGYDVQAAALNASREQTNNAGVAAFKRAGKQGEYRPSGQTDASLRRCDAALESLKAERTKAEAERSVELDRWTKNMEKFEAAVREIEAKIEAKRKLFETE